MIYAAHAVGSAALAAERVERKLAVILAADVAGYSRLMGMDEEGTLAALEALRRELADPKIKELRGRIVPHRRSQVRDKLAFSFEDMGEQRVKNIARPVRAHRIVLGEVGLVSLRQRHRRNRH
jgi:class 3 adenylate cyclase